MQQRIQTYEIKHAVGRRLWPAHSRPGQRIRFLDCQPEAKRILQRHEHAIAANSICDEVRRILGDDHSLAKPLLAHLSQQLYDSGISVCKGNNLYKLHITGRVKKMRNREMPAQLLASSLHHRSGRQAGRIRRNDRVRSARSLNKREHLALNIQPLDNRLYNPIRLLKGRQMI
ncbi:hypothetical protein D3C78_872800 [compost metagenome]